MWPVAWLAIAVLALVTARTPAALAFMAGPGNVKTDFPYYTHEAIEELGLLPRSRPTNVTLLSPVADRADLHALYFGNWLRDLSQSHDISIRQYFSEATVDRVVKWLAGSAGFDQRDPAFRITPEILGVYRPEEHVDNPELITQDVRDVVAGYRPPVKRNEVDYTRQLAQRRYIQSDAKRKSLTSIEFIERQMRAAIEQMRASRREVKANRLPEARIARLAALRELGAALHSVEDFYAHSNFVELLLRYKLGLDKVYGWTDLQVKLPNGRGCKLATEAAGVEQITPLTTGTHAASNNLTDLWLTMLNNIRVGLEDYSGGSAGSGRPISGDELQLQAAQTVLRQSITPGHGSGQVRWTASTVMALQVLTDHTDRAGSAAAPKLASPRPVVPIKSAAAAPVLPGSSALPESEASGSAAEADVTSDGPIDASFKAAAPSLKRGIFGKLASMLGYGSDAGESSSELEVEQELPTLPSDLCPSAFVTDRWSGENAKRQVEAKLADRARNLQPSGSAEETLQKWERQLESWVTTTDNRRDGDLADVHESWDTTTGSLLNEGLTNVHKSWRAEVFRTLIGPLRGWLQERVATLAASHSGYWKDAAVTPAAHAQMSKDFPDHPLHELSARLAARAAAHVAHAVVRAWEPGLTYLRRESRIRRAVELVRGLLQHPLCMPETSPATLDILETARQFIGATPEVSEWFETSVQPLLTRDAAETGANKLY